MNGRPASSAAQCLCDVSRLLFERDLTDLCGGNVSLRDGDRIFITPTCAAEYFLWDLSAEDVVVLAPDGTILRGDKSRLSRENDLHLRIYRTQPRIHSVFHLHTVELMLLAERPDLLTGCLQPFLREQGIGLALLPADLVGQTPEHDDRLMELLGRLDPARPAVIVAPRHGIFATATDTAANLISVDGLVCHVRQWKLVRDLVRASR